MIIKSNWERLKAIPYSVLGIIISQVYFDFGDTIFTVISYHLTTVLGILIIIYAGAYLFGTVEERK